MLLIIFLGKRAAKAICLLPAFQGYYKHMRGLKKKQYRIFLDTGIEIGLNDHVELLVKLFLTILAKDPFEWGINVTVKYFKFDFFLPNSIKFTS